MPTKDEVWAVADRMRREGRAVSARKLRDELQNGGSYRDVGPLVSAWKVERSYLPGIELSGLPEKIQTSLARATAGLWEAAMSEATRHFAHEREQHAVALQAEREVRDDALEAADRSAEQVQAMKIEIERLNNELSIFRSQANGFRDKLLELRSAPPDPDGVRASERGRSRQFWIFIKETCEGILREEPAESPGLTSSEFVARMPAAAIQRADEEGEVINASNLSKRLHESAHRGRRFVRDGDRYLLLVAPEINPDDLDDQDRTLTEELTPPAGQRAEIAS